MHLMLSKDSGRYLARDFLRSRTAKLSLMVQILKHDKNY